MKLEELLFCRLVRLALRPEEISGFTARDIEAAAENSDALFSLAKNHNMQLALYDSLCALQVPLSASLRAAMREMVISYSLGSYQMLAFTRRVLFVLEEERVDYILLKGVSLLSCYPKLEFRAYGDVDVLIANPKEFARVRDRFLAEGYTIKEDFVDHQLELFCTMDGRRYLLELHSKVVGSQDSREFNRKAVELFSGIKGIPGHFEEAGLRYMAFPHTENAVYLLLHMLQHFLSSGFGVKLLCDWTVYLEAHSGGIDWGRYQEMVDSMGLTGFSHAMTQLCIKYFGLPEQSVPLAENYMVSDDALEELMGDVMAAGEFGKNDTSRMLIMANGRTPVYYLLQLHRQMKNRFPRAHRLVVIWPVLWVATGVCFLWNNHAVRRTSTREVLATTKRRHELLRELHLFERSGERGKERQDEGKS